MKNIVKAAAAGLLYFGFVSTLAAAGNTVLGAAGFDAEAVAVPAAPAPAAVNPVVVPDIFGCLGYGKSARAEVIYGEKGLKAALAAPITSINLEEIKGAYLRTAVNFTTGAGTKVSVSSYKASNCPDGGSSCATKDKIFLVLTTDKGASYFVKGIDIVNFGIFMHGSKTVAIDGENYVLKAYANVSSPDNSKLEIKGPRGTVVNSSLIQVADAQARRGVDVALSKPYKLLYGNEILQGPQGVRFGPGLQVVLAQYPVTDKSDTQIFNISEVNPAGVSFPFESGYSFKLEGGFIGIYKI